MDWLFLMFLISFSDQNLSGKFFQFQFSFRLFFYTVEYQLLKQRQGQVVDESVFKYKFIMLIACSHPTIFFPSHKSAS